MEKHYKAVIFDLDGTLIDSMWVWEKVDIQYLGQRGLTPPEDLEQALEGMSFTETANYFKKRFNIEDDVEKIKDEWRQMAWSYYVNDVVLKPGVLVFLNYLKQKGIKIGIATSNTQTLVHGVLDKLGIKHYFDKILTSCEVQKGKPHPDIYLGVAKALGVATNQCLVFEDVPNGVKSGKKAGMDVWGVYDRQNKEVLMALKTMTSHMIQDYEDVILYFETQKQDALG